MEIAHSCKFIRAFAAPLHACNFFSGMSLIPFQLFLNYSFKKSDLLCGQEVGTRSDGDQRLASFFLLLFSNLVDSKSQEMLVHLSGEDRESRLKLKEVIMSF